jgi:phosphoribosylformylglycinamidine synthase
MARISDGDHVVADIPISALSEPPAYPIQGREDRRVTAARQRSLADLPLSNDLSGALLRLVATPTIGSKTPVYQQYDHQVGNNTVIPPGRGDAGVLRIKGTDLGLALTADVNPRWCYLDPYRGGALAVAEAARNLSCVGARPMALTDCLNFGNPERPEVAHQMVEAVRGMSDACRALGVPVISGNVSLYNESENQAIYPTPAVGMAGILQDVQAHATAAFQNEGDAIFLIGADRPALPVETLGASEFLEREHDLIAGQPGLDLDAEVRVQALVRTVIERRLTASAHDVSDGGLGVTLAESCVLGNIGARFEGWGSPDRWDATLFGEVPARVVVSIPESRIGEFEAAADQASTPIIRLGTVGGETFSIADAGIEIRVSELHEAWSGAVA